MTILSPGERSESPYYAFKDDRARLWALISRDIQLAIIAVLVVGIPLANWRSLWRLTQTDEAD